VAHTLTRPDEQTGAESADTPVDTGRRVTVTFLVALIAFFCMGAGWATALPPNGTYDEAAHIYRAYGVATGQIYASDGIQRVPGSLVPGNPNCTWQDKQPASCQVVSHDRTEQPIVSTAAAYSPIYYLPVGLPMVLFKDHTGLLLGRYVSALLSALALAAALALAVALRARLAAVAALLVATPITLNLAGAINPNGLEIACGVLFWMALLGLLRPPGRELSERLTRRLVVLAAVSGSLLMTIRYFGPLLLGLSLGAALLIAYPGRVRALLRRRDVRITGAVLAVAFVVAAGWIITSGSTNIQDTQGRQLHLSTGQMGKLIVLERMPFWVQQIVGQFSYGETIIPTWTIVLWYALVAALVVPALLIASRRVRWTIIGLAAALYLMLVGLEVHFVNAVGWVSHGRYAMPAGCGIVLAAAFVHRWRTALGDTGTVRLGRAVVLLALPVHLWALVTVMTRFQSGINTGLTPWRGVWMPAGGPWLPIGIEIAGLITLGALGWLMVTWPDRATRVPE
jgi:hypothetical protein